MKQTHKFILRLVLLIIAGGFTLCGSAQQFKEALKKFNAVEQGRLNEKLFVHINKDIFFAGETIWFKIYDVDGLTNKPLALSKVAYIELMDNMGHVISQVKVGLKKSTGNGYIVLPAQTDNGHYQFRAYTSWMKNFDPAYYFSQSINVINPKKTLTAESTAQLKYDVQFFPEGGHLVNGLESRIAFKVTASDGRNVDANGFILNKKNDTVARFTTLKFGIGSFSFIPLEQSGYQVVLKIQDKNLICKLPQISNSGYVMQVETSAAGWAVNVKNVGDSTDVFVVVHNRNTIAIAQAASLKNHSTTLAIESDKVHEGLNYVTLFNALGQPVCERLIFKQPRQKLFVTAATDAKVYPLRKKVTVNVNTYNQTNKTTSANMSVSVFKAGPFPVNTANDIAGYLWLSASLKGHVASPGYYLNNNTPEAKQALDNLLLSQGWSQFDWNDVLLPEKPVYEFMPEFSGPVITARIVNTQTNKPAAGINAYLTIPGKYHQLYVAKSDTTGSLMFNTKATSGYKEIIVKTGGGTDSIYHVDVLSPFSDKYVNSVSPVLSLPDSAKKLIAASYADEQINADFLKVPDELVVFESSYFYNKAAYSYNLDDYTRFPTMAEVIHEYVRFISVSTENGKPYLRMSYNKSLLPGQPVAIVDGEPIFEPGEIYRLDPLKIKQLDVINNYYLYGPIVFKGIIGLTTYNGDRGNIVLDPRAITIDYEGLQLTRKFYAPVYDTEQQLFSPLPDFRSDLYWNADVNTDAEGHGSLNFYTGDKEGVYIGVIQGISQSGEAGSVAFSIRVKR